MRTRALRIIVLTGLAIISEPLQSPGQCVTAFGFKVGVTNANQKWSYSGLDDHRKWQLGFDVGVYAEWLHHPLFGLNSEIHFLRKGSSLPDIPVTTTEWPDGTGEAITISSVFDYVSFSLLPRFQVALETVDIYALLGPRVDVLVHQSVNVKGSQSIGSLIQQSFDMHPMHYRDLDIGADFAFGCRLPGLLLSGLGAEIRYSPDFTAAYEIPNANMTNRSWEFLLTVTF